MNFYTIHCKNSSEPTPIVVKEGFNWHHLFFNIFWAIYHKVWILVLVYIALYLLLAILGYLGLNSTIRDIVILTSYIALSFHANDFYRQALKQHGYSLSDLTIAHSANQALYQYLKKPLKI